MGAGDARGGRASRRARGGRPPRRRDLALEAALEEGRLDGSGATYTRATAGGRVLVPLGSTRLLARAQLGLASAALPPHRTFVLGGRGTLLGEAFRTWGGRRMALVHLEWRVPLSFASIALGSWARTPGRLTVAPYVATGSADRPVVGTPWSATPGARTTLGLALEWLGVFRPEARVGGPQRPGPLAVDGTPDLWGILWRRRAAGQALQAKAWPAPRFPTQS